MIIIGAGAAGATAAVALREQGWDGEVIVLGAEAHAPYERPPLSKAIITQSGDPALPVLGPAARFAELQIGHRVNAHATAIDADQRQVHLRDGTVLPYSRLLISTGARPRHLACEPEAPVLYLRSFDDALALRQRFQQGQRIVIIGGGFIGLELAASARQCGCAVSVVEFAPKVLMRAVPPLIADFIAARHVNEGVDLRLGVTVSHVGADKTLVLSDGSRLAADCIVAGIGAVPEIELAKTAGLTIENGIASDATLRTSRPEIFAAGDCCSVPLALYGGRRVRLEAWRNGLDQGKLAARNMLGASEAYNAVPWFWSDQYDVHVQIAGLAEGAAQHVSRDMGADARLVFHLDENGRLLAASGAGPIGKIAKNIKLAEILVARQARCHPPDLANPDFPLKSLIAR